MIFNLQVDYFQCLLKILHSLQRCSAKVNLVLIKLVVAIYYWTVVFSKIRFIGDLSDCFTTVTIFPISYLEEE
jgi:hypothetical protein